jgi:uncharacterized protein YutE (UPF0331/DUF86 family)
MTEKKIILLSLIFSLAIIASAVLAQGEASVAFPIKELGNCRSFRECADFCDRPENAKVCTEFAEGHGMVMPEQAERAKRMLDSTAMGGPGGCQNEDECKAYCDDITHIDECIAFAEQHGFMSPEELAEAKAVAAAIKRGINPPGNCGSKEDCDEYCEEPAHIDECIAFAEAAGFMRPEEAQMVRKTGGKGPGGCQGKKQCDAYCNAPEHMEECMVFAEEHNLIPPEEREDFNKMREAMRKGVKPPPCRGRAECDVYCSKPENAEQCIDFAVAAGFIPPEEAENVRRMAKAGIMGGPGGCKGKAECETYCDNPDHMVECVDFAEKAGFMRPEEAQMARKMAEKGIMGGPGGCKSKEQCEAYCQIPEHGEECMNFAVEAGFMKPEEAERMRGMHQMMMRGGPGGCKGEKECRAYCDDPAHQEECFRFAKENNLIPPEELERMERGAEMMGQGGPGGCRGPEECEAYCREHGEECMKWGQERGFMPPTRGRCGWCGDSCVKMEPEMICAMVMPPRGYICIEEKGNCTAKEVGEGMMPPFQGPMPPEGQMPSEGMMPPKGVKPPYEGDETFREEKLRRAQEMIRESLSRLTPEMRECVILRLGQGMYDKLQSGDWSGFTVEDSNRILMATGECVNQFRLQPQMPPEGMMQPPPPEEQPTSFIESLLGIILYPIELIFR